MQELRKFIKDQLSIWPLAATNFRALKAVKTREFPVFGLPCRIQWNPERVGSSTADTSPEAIAARPCFLCEKNRPPEQHHIKFEGRKGRTYNVQINPFPIFKDHLVIVRDEHLPQAIWHHMPDILDFARKYPDFTAFYNGPASGASAPDHLHFQAAPRHRMPLEEAVDAFLDAPGEALASVKDATLYRFPGYCRGVYALKATTSKSLTKLFYRLLDCCDRRPDETEPKFNLYAYVKGAEWRCFVVLRSAKRSHHFDAVGEEHLTVSPGAADMAGVFVTPFREDFEKATPALLEAILDEVTIPAHEQEMIEWRLTRTQPRVAVGILAAEEICFEIISDGAGPQRVRWCDGRIAYNGALYDELFFDSITRSTRFAEPSFILHDVVIGIDFHWQQKRTLKFAGGLKFIVEGDKVRAVNLVGMEDYLLSVISSEMKSSASVNLLKAHAVISRSWLLARMRDRLAASRPDRDSDYPAIPLEGAQGVKISKVEIPHRDFDVCADDHCQRYQGLTMAVGDNVRTVIDETWGQVLRYQGQLCDTRYSKCCGGKTELFSTCWEDVDYPYLQCVDDPWCDCENDEILSQVLNDYDQTTKDFHDWTVRYGADELAALVRERTGIDFGEIQALEPIKRGPSGRIKYLRIVGSQRTEVVGKELKIRRALSSSHLKSSAFEVERDPAGAWILRGRGWGHGVGLCQIGAAVMAARGFDYRKILQHYYPGTDVE
jgi:SpoIID/LytB domain protein